VWPDVLHVMTEHDSASVRSLSREIRIPDYPDAYSFRERLCRSDVSGHTWLDTPPHLISSEIRVVLWVRDRTLQFREGPTHRLQTLAPRAVHSCCHWPDASVVSRPRSVQCPVTPVTSFCLCFFASGAVENRRFTSTKALNPFSQARREGERNTNPSLLLKLRRLHKCANTTKCTSPCACVLAFCQIFFKELASH
jgi:hypothetical protein